MVDGEIKLWHLTFNNALISNKKMIFFVWPRYWEQFLKTINTFLLIWINSLISLSVKLHENKNFKLLFFITLDYMHSSFSKTFLVFSQKENLIVNHIRIMSYKMKDAFIKKTWSKRHGQSKWRLFHRAVTCLGPSHCWRSRFHDPLNVSIPAFELCPILDV